MAAANPRLNASDAVAALIRLNDGRLLMQLRDPRPDIWYPATWGCFGGAVNPGEEPLAALYRELHEELEFHPRDARYFTRFDFDFRAIGMIRCYRIFFVVPMSAAEHARIALHEGQAHGAFTFDELSRGMPITPYDAFALDLLRIGEQSGNATRENTE